MGGSKSETPQLLEPAWQTQMRKRLAAAAEPGAMSRLGRAGESYTGELVAGPSEYEQQGLQGLSKWLESAMPTEDALYGASKEELMKTLTGGYDPGASPYYKAFRNNVMTELDDAKNRMRSTKAASGSLYGGSANAEERQLETRAVGNLEQTMGGIYEAERGRRLGAVPEALRMLQFEEQAPENRVRAAMSYGALPRELEQAQLQAAYQEWQRALQDQNLSLDTATGLSTYKPEYYQPTYGPNPVMELVKAITGWGGDEGSSAQLMASGK